MKKLYLDDVWSVPEESQWDLVRTFDEFVVYLQSRGCPNHISFDHDLGEDKTGMDCAKYLVEMDIEQNGMFIPNGFTYSIHSSNFIGRENIDSYLSNYLAQRRGS